MPAQDREAIIKISAKNLTEDEFKKVKKGLKGIGGSALESDKKVGGLQRGITGFSKAAPGALKIVTAAALATAGAVLGIAAAVIKLGDRGGKVIALSTAFGRLTTAVGETGSEMIAVTTKATKGLVSDLEIMKAANKGLLLGLPITTKEMGSLAETALVLGRAMGLDATKSLDDLITALGRSSPMILDNLGITVKLGDANLAFAKKLGVSSKSLTEAQRKTAFYEETLRVAKIKVGELGGVQLNLGDMFDQSKVKVTNFVDELAKMIAKSPVLLGAMTSIGEAVSKAFGDDQQGSVLTTTQLIEKAALAAVSFAIGAVEGAQAVLSGWGGIQVLILGVVQAFVAVAAKMADTGANILETAAKIPVLGRAYQDAAIEARAAADEGAVMNESLREQVSEAALAALGHTALGETLSGLKEILIGVSTDMVNAGVSTRDFNLAVTEGQAPVANLGTSFVITKEQVEAMREALEATRKRMEKMNDVSEVWKETMTRTAQQVALDQLLVRSAYSETGMTINGVTLGVVGAFQRMGLKTRDELQKSAEQAVKDYETIKESGVATAGDLTAAFKKMEESKREMSEGTAQTTVAMDQQALAGSSAILGQFATRNKAAAIAKATIDTILAVQRTFANMGGWPLALIPMGIAAALGAINVAKIASQPASFREGTGRLDFENFFGGRPANLHGLEAVIPQGKGHMLAREIADAMGSRNRGGDPELTAALGELRSGLAGLRNLPREIQRAMRDGIQLAAV